MQPDPEENKINIYFVNALNHRSNIIQLKDNVPNYTLMNISVCVSKNACFYAYDLYMDIENLHMNK